MTENQYKIMVALEELHKDNWEKPAESDEDFVKKFRDKVKKRKEQEIDDPITATQNKLLNTIIKQKEG